MPSLLYPWRPPRWAGPVCFALGTALLAGCEGRLSTLDPASSEALLIADLAWLMFALSAAVMVLVGGLLLWALWRGRRQKERSGPENSAQNGRLLVVAGGVVLPLIVLPVLWVLSLQGMAALAEPDEPPVLEVEVVGRQWRYEIFYAGSGVRLNDEIRIPARRPVLLRLQSEDVIHSFWVPRLGGKTDLIPGLVNETWIRAAEPGVYEGRCAEYCGIGHTAMALRVIALEPAEFDAWLAEAAP